MITLGTAESGALFSDDEHWRFALWRRWEFADSEFKRVMFVGLNPSTADHEHDDPTVRRCINFSKAWGFGGMFMMNAYAFRATDPKNMKLGRRFDDSPIVTNDPVGFANNTQLNLRAQQSSLVIAAWGVHCDLEREREVLHAIASPVHCLGKTKHGRPKHPLYLRNDVKPELFWSP